MARTGARRKCEGEHRQPDTPGDPTGPFTRRTGLENLSASRDGDHSQTPWKGAQPNRWSGLETRTRTRTGWNRTRLPSIFLRADRLSASQFNKSRTTPPLIARNAAGRDHFHHPSERIPRCALPFKNRAQRSGTRSPSLPERAHPALCAQFTNRRSRTLFTSPSIKNIATIFDPPELISGSGMPVTGIRPTTIPTFTST
jgi:hypothetical protein